MVSTVLSKITRSLSKCVSRLAGVTPRDLHDVNLTSIWPLATYPREGYTMSAVGNACCKNRLIEQLFHAVSFAKSVLV